jgi:Subtilase family
VSDQPKFLLGQGETLTSAGRYRSGPNSTEPPYELDVQQAYLSPQLKKQQAIFDGLPAAACPGDVVVSMLTLHPQYYSRSNFPVDLLSDVGLRLVGSMPKNVKPRQGRGSNVVGGIPSTVLFVAGTRATFRKLTEAIGALTTDDPLAADMVKIEGMEAQTAKERVQSVLSGANDPLELVLHFDAQRDFSWEAQFLKFAEKCGLKIDPKKTYQARGLWFLEAKGTAKSAKQLADFSFVRAIRPMPQLRPLEEPNILRSAASKIAVTLPADGPLDPNCRVAVFDGGLPENHPFKPWAVAIEPGPKDGIGSSIPDYQLHGMAVTSALLFGNMTPGVAPRPYGFVDHYRVLGTGTVDQNLYGVMLYIDKILSSKDYDFASFSIGPIEIIGDDQVSLWTTMLDDHFHQARMLGTIAVGNDGTELPPHNRVQVPSDCVNALAVGASDGSKIGWKRAPYSSVGPGRAPGIVKPDVVHFGGVDGDEFVFLYAGGKLARITGTSFASPTVMRLATAIRAHFGTGINPLSIRSLIVHSTTSGGNPRDEVGWGLAPDDITEVTVCPDGSVRVLYQGWLDPSKVQRAIVPLPAATLVGKVTVRATFCYSCQTDPHTPGDYTRAGLGVTFRPHKGKFPKPPKDNPHKKPDPDFPESKSFFEGVGRKSEQALRFDAFKWDTVRHAEHTFMGKSLDRPVFDIHYQARQPGRSNSPSDAPKLRYALVVTVTATKHPDLYEKVLSTYPTLAPLTPLTNLPVKINAPVRTSSS